MSEHDQPRSDDDLQEGQDPTEPEVPDDEEVAPSTTPMAQTDLPEDDAEQE